MYAHDDLSPKPVTDPVNDERAIIAAALRDPAAFAPLYERYAPAVYRLCYRAVNNAATAEDLAARVFVLAIERLDRYVERSGATFRSWLFAIARNVVVDNWRTSHTVHLPEGVTDYLPSPAPGPEELSVHATEMEALVAALGTLTVRHRTIIELRLSGLTTAEIADVLDLSVSAVKSAQTRAYANLRAELTDFISPKGAHR